MYTYWPYYIAIALPFVSPKRLFSLSSPSLSLQLISLVGASQLEEILAVGIPPFCFMSLLTWWLQRVSKQSPIITTSSPCLTVVLGLAFFFVISSLVVSTSWKCINCCNFGPRLNQVYQTIRCNGYRPKGCYLVFVLFSKHGIVHCDQTPVRCTNKIMSNKSYGSSGCNLKLKIHVLFFF